MRIGDFEFSPGRWPTVAILLVFPLLASLGNWQLERAAWKQDLINTHAATVRQLPRPLADLLDSTGPLDFVPVAVTGRYDLAQQLLLDNRIHLGAAGYHVLTPLATSDGHGVVLVNRGWIPLGISRAELPALPGPDHKITVSGTITRLPEKVFRLDAAEEQHAGWPQVIQHVDFGAIEQRLGYALLPVIIQLDKAAPNGFARDWKPVYGITPDKHRAYAMQWFTLALVLVLIYTGVNTKRVKD